MKINDEEVGDDSDVDLSECDEGLGGGISAAQPYLLTQPSLSSLPKPRNIPPTHNFSNKSAANSNLRGAIWPSNCCEMIKSRPVAVASLAQQ